MKGPLGGKPKRFNPDDPFTRWLAETFDDRWRAAEAPRPFPPAPSWCHVCGIHYAPHPSKPCPTCEEN